MGLKLIEQVKTLEGKVEEARSKLKELSETSDDAWDSVKEGVDSAWDSIKKGLKDAASKYK